MTLGAVRSRRRLLLLVGLAAHWASRGRDFVGSGRARPGPRCSSRIAILAASPGSRTLRHELGDIVEVRCEDDGLWYQAIVEHENPDGTFTVRYDKDGYEYHYPLTAWRVPKARHFIEELEEGEVLNGRVTDISSTGFYVDVGAEDEGFVHISEIKEGRVAKIVDEVRIGQDVSVRVLSTSNGKLTLSMKPVAKGDLAAFRDLPDNMVLKATITETPTFGAFALVQPPGGGEPFRGLIHISQMGRGFVQSVEDEVSVGQEVLVSVISTEGDRLSLRLENPEKSVQIDPGIWLTGTVVKTMPYGAFVKVEWQGQEMSGLLHVSEIEDDFIVDCQDAISVNDNITVQLLQSKAGRISWTARKTRLSSEELDPFVGLSRKKDFLTGLVQETSERGAYVLLQPPEGGIAVQGVLRRQEMDLKDGENVEDVVKMGEEVEVLVKSAENGRLTLCMPKAREVPEAFHSIPDNLWLRGVVKNVEDYGAFVQVQAPGSQEEFSGLVHISQCTEDFVEPERLREEMKVGQEVSVRVLQVGVDRLSLSMKLPANASSSVERNGHKSAPKDRRPPPPKAEPLEGIGPEQLLDATIKETRSFGALADVVDPGSNQTVLGRIHIMELSEHYVDSVEDVVSVDDQVKVRLLNRDDLSFSLRPPAKPRSELAQLDDELVAEVLNVSGNWAQLQLPGGESAANTSNASTTSVIGYLHQSQMAMDGEPSRPKNVEDLVQGQEVKVRIISDQGNKLALTMRPPAIASSLMNFAECKEVLKSVVQEVTPLGIFVRLQPPSGGPACRGLIHVSLLEHDSKFAEGDLVQVKVHQVSNSSLLLSLA